MATTSVQDVMEFVQQTLGLKAIDRETQMGRVRGWDSLRHLKLINSLEKKYGVSIPVDMLGELSKVDKILAYLAEAGVVRDEPSA